MDQPKIERVMKLIELLTGNVNYTIEDLANKLKKTYSDGNISQRTIYRYIDTLNSAGFSVVKNERGIYKLSKESKWLKKISDLLFITEEEAAAIDQVIVDLDDENPIKQNLRAKLASVYNCRSVTMSTSTKKRFDIVRKIDKAINEQYQVVFHNYSSAHSNTVSDRTLEPFQFVENYIQVWCYDPNDGQNKLFSTDRIESVEVTSTPWQFKDKHVSGFYDIFHCSSQDRLPVKLKMGIRSHSLLLSEYPLAANAKCKQLDESHWLMQFDVSSYFGVGRFVMGLASDIEIIDTPGLEKYIGDFVNENLKKYL